jgi:D-alanyl-D-alanine carboxypeptidase
LIQRKILLLFCCLLPCIVSLQSYAQTDSIPQGVKKLIEAYPAFIAGYNAGFVIWKDGTKMPYNDGMQNKLFAELLNKPSLSDQMSQKYQQGKLSVNPAKNYDPGRIRYEPFFFKMYGTTQAKVRKNLVEITWCPKLVGQKILITTINGVDKKVKELSAELDTHPELKEYIKNIGGTFNWRKINGANRQSTHSFGMTIDINTKFSNYWQWECKCTNEYADTRYKNRIPQLIVDIFERHGFIWGGKWYHFDTMHFEYRPELL